MYEQLLTDFTAMCRQILGSQLTGVYLHGSMAMGCFHPERSDIDLIVVVESPMTSGQKTQLMEHILLLNAQAPAKGLEVSFVMRANCNPFVYPTPFELHASPVHLPWFQAAQADYVEKMQGTDRDLAAHFTIINHYGIPLYGREIPEVFGSVPETAYFDSIWHDVQDAGQEIGVDTVYVVLNLCRVLAFVQDGLILSKAEGGNWGLTHLPREFHPLIQQALACYQSGRAIPPDAPMQEQFASAMLSAIRREAQARRLCDGAASP